MILDLKLLFSSSGGRAATHGLYTTAAPKKSLMITTHSSRSREKEGRNAAGSLASQAGEPGRSDLCHFPFTFVNKLICLGSPPRLAKRTRILLGRYER